MLAPWLLMIRKWQVCSLFKHSNVPDFSWFETTKQVLTQSVTSKRLVSLLTSINSFQKFSHKWNKFSAAKCLLITVIHLTNFACIVVLLSSYKRIPSLWTLVILCMQFHLHHSQQNQNVNTSKHFNQKIFAKKNKKNKHKGVRKKINKKKKEVK